MRQSPPLHVEKVRANMGHIVMATAVRLGDALRLVIERGLAHRLRGEQIGMKRPLSQPADSEDPHRDPPHILLLSRGDIAATTISSNARLLLAPIQSP